MAIEKNRRRRKKSSRSKSRNSKNAIRSNRVSSADSSLVGFRKYWVIVAPAVLLNIAFAMNHAIATNHANAFKENMKAAAEAVRAKVQEKDPLDETLRAHWITTNEDGNLEGRISSIEPSESIMVPIEQLDVTLLKKGQKIKKSTTGDDGKFTLNDVEPGVYTLVASGQNGFLAYGVHVLPKLEAVDELQLNTSTDQDAKSKYYVSLGVPEGVEVQDELQIDAAAIPPEFSTLERLSDNYLPAAAAFSVGSDTDDVKAINKATDIKGGFKFPLDEDGNFNGRIQPIATAGGKPAKLSEMNVFLIQDDLEVARVAVEENGRFEIEDVEEGVYAIVAAGKDGFAALSMELVSSPTEDVQSSQMKRGGFHYVSNITAKAKATAKSKKAPSLGIAIVTDPADLKAIQNEVRKSANLRRQLRNQPQRAGVDNGMYQPPNSIVNGGFPQGALPAGQPIVGQPYPVSSVPSGFGGAPVQGGPAPGFGPSPVPQGPGFAPPSGNGGSGLLVGGLLIALGVDGLSDDSIQPPPSASPF